jgi:hypothetical protein
MPLLDDPAIFGVRAEPLGIGPEWDECPECESQLELDQPLSERPETLFGACPFCQRLFLFHDAATTGMVRMLLPKLASVVARLSGDGIPFVPVAGSAQRTNGALHSNRQEEEDAPDQLIQEHAGQDAQ